MREIPEHRSQSPDQMFGPWGAMRRETHPVWAEPQGNEGGPSYGLTDLESFRGPKDHTEGTKESNSSPVVPAQAISLRQSQSSRLTAVDHPMVTVNERRLRTDLAVLGQHETTQSVAKNSGRHETLASV
ncbi:hypothetical protein BBP40_006126 [Aspergillus hancockii]|nr:hypothetical protein BBP40_006126 [Aspergillus hancockii]